MTILETEHWCLVPEDPCHPKREASIRRTEMTLCPIAIVAGCNKCPAFTVCPLKGVVGDYKKPEEAPTKQHADEARRDVKREG
jgi:hypothetical protein